MTDNDADTARARAQAMRGARLTRARKIRRRIVGGSVALFVATWLLITIVLVSGHDPALAKRSSATTTTVASSSPTTTTSAPTTTSTTTGATTTTGTSSSSSGNSSSGTVSGVTTSQS